MKENKVMESELKQGKEEAVEEYTADSIRALKGLEAVRKRPAMYIGDTSVRGLHHLVFEVVDNSIDEAMAGFCTEIYVTLHRDGSVSVLDNGRGIPVDIHKEYGVPAVEVVLTVLHAGGKFDSNIYKVSGGLHGVGVSCVNALSKWLEVEVYRGGLAYRQSFQYGKKVSELEVLGKTDKRGTKITFKPDGSIFETTQFSFEILSRRLRELAFLNRGVKITLEDKRTGQKEVYHYEGGLEEFIRYLNQNKTPVHEEVIYFLGEQKGVFVEVALQYTQDFSENLYSFANNICTSEGGTHLSGFKSALTGTINRYGKSQGMLKNLSLSGEDVREGLTAVISVKVPNPQFEGQTKTKLGNREVQGIVETIVNDKLAKFLEEHPASAKAIVQRAIYAAQVRQAAKKARDLARRKNALSSHGLPGKLADCTSRNVEETELYIVEGESAGGSAKQGRNRHFQAVLPLKGKILNVEKTTPLKMLKHAEIQTIITAIGTGINEHFDITKARYGKIIIMTDADVDGHHIRTLLLTFFYRYMPELIEKGYVYIANPPLYKVTRKKFEKYYHSEEEIRRDLFEYSVENTVLLHLDSGKTLEGEELRQLLQALRCLEEQEKFFLDQGLPFVEYLEKRRQGRLPSFLVKVGEKRLYFYGLEELQTFLKEKARSEEGIPSETGKFDYQMVEFHEREEIEKALEKIESLGLPLSEYEESLQEGEGEKGYFQVIYEKKEIPETYKYHGLYDALIQLSQKSQHIQRFKGLGEMNPEQLWETTMNPETRVLYRVKIEDPIEPDRIFSILMGSDVEPRRRFIEEHALEVKQLDV